MLELLHHWLRCRRMVSFRLLSIGKEVELFMFNKDYHPEEKFAFSR